VPATGIFKQLYAASPGLQRHLLVLGGYFAAPWLAVNDPVHFVIAGKDKDAVSSLAQLMPDAPNAPIQHDKRFGKSDQLFGTAIMGALKNQAVYAFARNIVRQCAQQMWQKPEWKTEQHCVALNAWADPVAETAIRDAEKAVESLTYRGVGDDDFSATDASQLPPEMGSGKGPTGALGFKQIDDYHSAPGVRTDFERCMVRPVTPDFVRFIGSIGNILQLPAAEQGDRLAKLLATDVVDAGKGFGSRNSRDGVIDEALHLVFEAQQASGHCQSTDFAEFRQRFTPDSWLAKTTEGRSGAYPILNHLIAHGRAVPKLMEDAGRYYAQSDSKLAALLLRSH
jgi:hypothetical protein